jgi:hypothetical protein
MTEGSNSSSKWKEIFSQGVACTCVSGVISRVHRETLTNAGLKPDHKCFLFYDAFSACFARALHWFRLVRIRYSRSRDLCIEEASVVNKGSRFVTGITIDILAIYIFFCRSERNFRRKWPFPVDIIRVVCYVNEN